MKKALSLIQSGETVEFIKPWWEVVEQFTIDAMMLVAVTSVTADLFQGIRDIELYDLKKRKASYLATIMKEFLRIRRWSFKMRCPG